MSTPLKSIFKMQITEKSKFAENVKNISTACGLVLLAWGLMGNPAMAQSSTPSESQTFLETRQAGSNSRIDVLGSPWRIPFAIGVSQSRILVYRSRSAALSGATGIFVDAQYHTSLVPGGYSELCFAPGPVEVGARQMQVGNRARDRMDSLSALSLVPGQTLYLRVDEQTGQAVMQPVSAEQAQQDGPTLRYQLHTISRVSRAQPCTEVLAAQVPQAPAPRQISLSIEALFGFGRSVNAAMSAAGRRYLDKLIDPLRNDYVQFGHISILDYAGMQSPRITSEVRGDSEPL